MKPALAAVAGLLALASAPGCFAFELHSPDLTEGQRVPDALVFSRDGCTGGNVSPALAWSGAPEGTKSYAVTVDDPDAPGGSWIHWIVFDIDPSTTALERGAGSRRQLPPGAKDRANDFGTPGYAGPCPPPGSLAHRYVFTVHALKVPHLVVLSRQSDREALEAIRAAEIGRASIMARYSR